MLLDMNYEGRFYGSDGQLSISYPVLFALFILYGITIAILVNNLLIGLAVGEIPSLALLARLYGSTMRYELLNSLEIFRLRFIYKCSIVYSKKEVYQLNPDKSFFNRSQWIRQHFGFRRTVYSEDNKD